MTKLWCAYVYPIDVTEDTAKAMHNCICEVRRRRVRLICLYTGIGIGIPTPLRHSIVSECVCVCMCEVLYVTLYHS